MTIIGIAGWARHGKDTIGAELVEKHGFQRVSFAAPLYAMTYAINPLLLVRSRLTSEVDEPFDHWHPLQVVVDQRGWEWAKDHSDARDYLIAVGMSAREHIGEDVWVDAALKQLVSPGDYVITDVRFRNEAAGIKRLGGQVWRVWRPKGPEPSDSVSEHDLDQWGWDQVIVNDGTVDDLRASVSGFRLAVAVADASQPGGGSHIPGIADSVSRGSAW